MPSLQKEGNCTCSLPSHSCQGKILHKRLVIRGVTLKIHHAWPFFPQHFLFPLMCDEGLPSLLAICVGLPNMEPFADLAVLSSIFATRGHLRGSCERRITFVTALQIGARWENRIKRWRTHFFIHSCDYANTSGYIRVQCCLSMIWKKLDSMEFT